MAEDPLPAGSPLFPFSRFVHREIIVLIILCGAAIAGFVVTKAVASAAHAQRLSDAATWYERGEAALAEGRLDDALTALGRARALDRDRDVHHLSFASALAQAGQIDAARQVLLALRETHPENPDVNLGLAELAAASGASEDAVRFYQRALYGEWTPARLDDRERVRISLIEYQLEHGMRGQAAAQLLMLAADLPSDAARQMQAARLFLAAGEPEQALEHYRRVLESEPDHAAALAGAGDAAFEIGDFAAARGYYDRVPDGNEEVETRRELVRLVLANDPLQPRLSNAERRRRLARGQARARALIQACRVHLAGTSAQEEQLDALASELAALGSVLRGRRPIESGVIADGVALVSGVVSFASEGCGPLTPDARAWLLIGRLQREGRL